MYQFGTNEGTKTLPELFAGRSQLLVYHFMHGPNTPKGFNFGTPRRAALNVLKDEELMALSAFALEDGVVYHTYSAYDRGTDVLNPTWQLLDRSPKGRDQCASDGWPRRHD